jgi:hypothetical protein
LERFDLIRNSSLYREFQAEREELLKHKWIESEKAGHDIGFNRALTDWIIKHRASWREARKRSGRERTEAEIYLPTDSEKTWREKILIACGHFMDALGYE